MASVASEYWFLLVARVLLAIAAGLYVPSANVLYNPRKRVVYEVRDSIAVLLPDEAKPVTDAEPDAWTSDPSVIKTGK